MRPSAARLRSSETAYDVVDRMDARLDFDRPVDRQLACASAGQRALYALAAVDGEIQNGGFSQLFFNSTGELFEEAVAGAALFDARAYEELLHEAAGLFPGGRVPRSRGERERLVSVMSEAVLVRLDDRWFELWERDPLDGYYVRYLRRHQADFFHR